MPIQILGLREYTDSRTGVVKKRDAFFKKEWRAGSVHELFENIEYHISQVPTDERWNLFYTAADCLEEKGRKLSSQAIIPFDIDHVNDEHRDTVVEIVASTLNIDAEKLGVVYTGNGLQIIVGLLTPILSEEFFDQNREIYRSLCNKITRDIEGLTGTCDSSVFSPARLLRLPNTDNIKPIGTKRAVLIRNYTAIDWDMADIVGIPKVEANQQISEVFLKKLPPADPIGVQTCPFLKWTKENQASVSEPQWYAMLSIIGRLQGGHDLCHEYSKEHPDYRSEETDEKLKQAMTSSGPRTCKNIASLWDGCSSCEHWQKECKSPILIKSENYIRTRETGFRTIKIDKNGNEVPGHPDYDDLCLFFEEAHKYITFDQGKITYLYNGKCWKDTFDLYMEHFAEINVRPSPRSHETREFRDKVRRTKIVSEEFFKEYRKVNFKNGVLDLQTYDFHDHSEEFGFRYCLPFDYDPSAKCDRFDQFLEEVTLGDKELISVILEYLGYSLSGIDPAIGQKAMILVGEGSNGKSKLVELLCYLAGKDNYSSISMGRDIHNTNARYHLNGKLFNISEETPNNSLADSSLFKSLVTGGEVQVKKLYHDTMNMKNMAKIIMTCNELPPTKDLSHGNMRRLIIVPFHAKFTEANRDIHILDKLKVEASGIYNRCLQALSRFERQEHFTEAKKVIQHVEEYKEMNDDVLQWCKEYIELDRQGYAKKVELYMNYKFWCEMNGHRPRNNTWFYRRLASIYPETEETRIRTEAGKRERRILGINLLKEDE